MAVAHVEPTAIHPPFTLESVALPLSYSTISSNFIARDRPTSDRAWPLSTRTLRDIYLAVWKTSSSVADFSSIWSKGWNGDGWRGKKIAKIPRLEHPLFLLLCRLVNTIARQREMAMSVLTRTINHSRQRWNHWGRQKLKMLACF